jgi:hypothetical protein
MSRTEYRLIPGEWNKQYHRMMRYYWRFEKFGSGSEQISKDDAEDVVISFFQNCYHLKDWLKSDVRSIDYVKDIEKFINRSQNLSLCADIANGSKHLKLNKSSRSKVIQKTQRINYHHVLEIGSGSEGVKYSLKSITWTIETDKENFDGFKLATTCVNELREYLYNKGLIVKI